MVLRVVRRPILGTKIKKRRVEHAVPRVEMVEEGRARVPRQHVGTAGIGHVAIRIGNERVERGLYGCKVFDAMPNKAGWIGRPAGGRQYVRTRIEQGAERRRIP